MATKPTDYPEWDTDETNVLEADASHKLDGWLKPSGVGEKPLLEYFNWFMNLVYKWIIYMAEAKTVITTQAELDAVFDGTTIADSNIYLELAGSPYTLNDNVPYGKDLKIDADPGVILNRGGLYRFVSTGTVGTPISNVEFTKNLTFDGKKATYTMTTDGGAFDVSYVNNSKFHMSIVDSETTGDGGAYWSTTGSNNECSINNVSGCEAVNGGGVYGVYNSEISNVSGCTSSLLGNVSNCQGCKIDNISDNTGVGVYLCGNSTITNVSGDSSHGVSTCENCSVISDVHDNGVDGVTGCNKSVITNVHSNGSKGVSGSTDATITNIYNNTNDGVDGCSDSEISNVYDNSVDGVSGCLRSSISNVHGNTGVGVYLCHYSDISNIHSNTSYGVNNCNASAITSVHDNNATGVINCDGCTITHIADNSAPDSLAGGADSCDDCVFSGAFRGNTTTGGSNKHIRNCATGIAFAIGDGTTSVLSQTVRGPVSFN